MKLTLHRPPPKLLRLREKWRASYRTLSRVYALEYGQARDIPLMEVVVVPLSDFEIARLNADFLRHQGPTDVITFDYGNGSADILLSTETAQREAKRRGIELLQEIMLYTIHGLLHLAGFRDKTPSQRRRMRQAEKELLKKIL